MSMRLIPFAIAAISISAITTPAGADDAKSSATVGTGGAVKFNVARTFVHGEPLVSGTMTLPADWRFYSNSSEALTFVPKSAKYDRPSIQLAVRNDNLDPKEVVATAKAQSIAFKTKIMGGGKLVKTITASHELALGAHLHGLAASFEVDATKERSVHYVQTECYVWADDQPFILSYVGFAEMPDAKYVPDFEKTCSSIAIATTK